MYECLHGRNCESMKMPLKLQNRRFPSHFLSHQRPSQEALRGQFWPQGLTLKNEVSLKLGPTHIGCVWQCGLRCVQWKHLPRLTVVTVTVMRCWNAEGGGAQLRVGRCFLVPVAAARHFMMAELLSKFMLFARSRSHDDVTNGRLCFRGNISYSDEGQSPTSSRLSCRMK